MKDFPITLVGDPGHAVAQREAVRRLSVRMRTPWGVADSVVELTNGIRRVSTPSHGGYWVPAKLLPQIPTEYRAYASKWSGSDQWYEEDCAWACVAVTFPDVFDWSAGETLQHAKDTVARYVVRQ